QSSGATGQRAHTAKVAIRRDMKRSFGRLFARLTVGVARVAPLTRTQHHGGKKNAQASPKQFHAPPTKRKPGQARVALEFAHLGCSPVMRVRQPDSVM